MICVICECEFDANELMDFCVDPTCLLIFSEPFTSYTPISEKEVTEPSLAAFFQRSLPEVPGVAEAALLREATLAEGLAVRIPVLAPAAGELPLPGLARF